jgi:tRNA threonylcarbamoyladenosine biosynthesis protein TsaE
MAWPVVIGSSSVAETKALAGRLAGLCASGDVILLVGELGAGKTAFAQGFAAALGVEGPVTSPTFALVRQYRCAAGSPVDTLIHADVYRTGSLSEVADLALAELVEERAVALIEWGDMAAPVLGEDLLEVTIEVPPELPPEVPPAVASAGDLEHRTITVVGRGRWSTQADEVARAVAPAVAPAPTPAPTPEERPP